MRNFREHALVLAVHNKDMAMLACFQLPQYPVVARTEAHVVHASYSSDVIDVSCKKRRRCVSFVPYLEVFTTSLTLDLFLMFLTPRYLRTYNVVHGSLIAAAQMRAVETDHNQTTVERLEEADMKASRLYSSGKHCVTAMNTT